MSGSWGLHTWPPFPWGPARNRASVGFPVHDLASLGVTLSYSRCLLSKANIAPSLMAGFWWFLCASTHVASFAFVKFNASVISRTCPCLDATPSCQAHPCPWLEKQDSRAHPQKLLHVSVVWLRSWMTYPFPAILSLLSSSVLLVLPRESQFCFLETNTNYFLFSFISPGPNAYKALSR